MSSFRCLGGAVDGGGADLFEGGHSGRYVRARRDGDRNVLVLESQPHGGEEEEEDFASGNIGDPKKFRRDASFMLWAVPFEQIVASKQAQAQAAANANAPPQAKE